MLDGVSLQFARGEGVALLGPMGLQVENAALDSRVLRVDAGVARVQGRSTARPAGRRAVALVPQDAAVYDGLTAAENVALFARLHGLRGEALRRACHEALEAAGLTAVAGQRAGTYSGGMRRRLSLACALVHGPALLLLDEPFEGVDDASRRHLLEVLASAKERGWRWWRHAPARRGRRAVRAGLRLARGRVQRDYPSPACASLRTSPPPQPARESGGLVAAERASCHGRGGRRR